MRVPNRNHILIILLLICTHQSFVRNLEISSQIDLDSEEREQSADKSNSRTFVSLRQPGGQASKVSPFKSNSENVPLISRDNKKRRSHFVLETTSKQPTVINNIQIVVNGNDTEQGVSSCKNGICDVSVSSKPDGEGNIVTDVHLSIITKLNATPKVGDIPVFDGMRGSEGTFDRPQTFNFLNQLQPGQHLYNNMPEIQTHRQEPGETWYQGRRAFQRPQANWHYRRPMGSSDKGFPNQRGWIPSKPIVDDKIEPPLSKTEPINDS